MDTTLPSIFVSHGSPMIALDPREAGAFMRRLGPAIDARFGRPRAILSLSAHTGTTLPTLLAAPRHEAVYDFGDFDPRLNRMRYDAPGAPDLAPEALALLERAGIAARSVDAGGLDHGAWTSLRYIYPGADVPVLPLAWSPRQSPAEQLALGEALAPLAREGVLVFASGSITHNLRRVFAGGRVAVDSPEAADVREFRDWFAARSAARDWPSLLDYRRQAPHAVGMHPTDEHLLPWYIAAGAGGRDAVPLRLHDSVTYGVLGMDAYAFGEGAAALQAELSTEAVA